MMHFRLCIKYINDAFPVMHKIEMMHINKYQNKEVNNATESVVCNDGFKIIH